MPFTTVRLQPGVNDVMTQSLNAAGIVDSQNIRFEQGLVEKVAGWLRAFSTPFPDTSEMHPWVGLDGIARLAIAQRNGGLSLIDASSNISVITPRNFTNNPAVNFSTTNGSNVVTIVDAGSDVGLYDVVDIRTPVYVGGIVLYGLYSINEVVSSTTFRILAFANATSTVANGGSVPTFTTTNNNILVTVNATAHGKNVGDTFPVTFPVTVGGVTLSGFYIVISVPNANQFVVAASMKASSAATVPLNGGNANFVYWPNTQPPSIPGGYGMGTYGTGTYGVGSTGMTAAGTAVTAADWSLDNFGGTLIACEDDGPIFSFDPQSGFQTAFIVKEAPTINRGVIVSKEAHQIVAYGASVLGQQDPLLVAWSDVDNFRSWLASSGNLAGSYRLSSGSRIVAATNMGLVNVLFTDVDVWTMTFVGYASGVYSFKKLPSLGCGAVSKRCVAQIGAGLYWMGKNQFFTYSGSVRAVPCTVRDFVFNNIDWNYADRIFAAADAMTNEVTWYFPTIGSGGNCRSYVRLNTVDGVWDKGELTRVSWENQSVFGNPIGVDGDGYLNFHHVGHDDDAQPMVASFLTGWFTLAEAQQFVFIDQILPDFKFEKSNDVVMITMFAADEPGGPVRIKGPFVITPTCKLIGTRIRGRLMSMQIESTTAESAWRIGAVRFRYATAGRR